MLHALLRRTAMHARLPRAAPAAPAPALACRLRRATAQPPPPDARALAARAEPWAASYEREDPPFLEEGYSPEANAAYWATRPVAVAARSAAVAARLGGWAARGRLPGAGGPEARAAELLAILTRLGPAFVKIGQAVSARPDVLPPAYLAELEKLQDRLPPFPTPAAMAVLEAELGAPPSALFSSISAAPVAAASLGQVYRATLRAGGAEVAVKVQRPGVAGAIALDVFVLRGLARGLRAARRLNSDLPALLDEWAASLFRELDYRREAANGARFGELYGAMAGVLVPRMHGELTTRRVLVMEWVRGERLRSARDAAVDLDSTGGGAGAAGAGAQRYAPADAARDLALVEVGVRCSLEQMLEAGFYHADPHPGEQLFVYIHSTSIRPSCSRLHHSPTLHLFQC
jgi:aarF domain-containing kinase